MAGSICGIFIYMDWGWKILNYSAVWVTPRGGGGEGILTDPFFPSPTTPHLYPLFPVDKLTICLLYNYTYVYGI